MSLDLPEAIPDTIEEIFMDKFQYINMDHYNIYHFDEITIDGRRYQYRLSTKEDLMSVVCQFGGRYILLVSIWTNHDHEKRLREVNDYILQREREIGNHIEHQPAPGGDSPSSTDEQDAV